MISYRQTNIILATRIKPVWITCSLKLVFSQSYDKSSHTTEKGGITIQNTPTFYF